MIFYSSCYPSSQKISSWSWIDPMCI
uniref:Uncharacterized protein n=1 Tax=Rhizophora mucronata TaxID=61149 RepID=A0A2P2MZG6_RHIMU